MLSVSLPPRPSSWLSPLLPVRVSLKFEPDIPSILVNVEVLKPVACAAVLHYKKETVAELKEDIRAGGVEGRRV